MPMESTERDPEKYPTVTIDGKTYSLKFSLEQLDQMEDETGIDLGDLGQTALKGKAQRTRILTLLSYALKPAGVNLSPDELRANIELRHFNAIAAAMTETLGGKKTVAEPKPETPSVIK